MKQRMATMDKKFRKQNDKKRKLYEAFKATDEVQPLQQAPGLKKLKITRAEKKKLEDLQKKRDSIIDMAIDFKNPEFEQNYVLENYDAAEDMQLLDEKAFKSPEKASA